MRFSECLFALLGLCIAKTYATYHQYGDYQPQKYPTSYQTYDNRIIQDYKPANSLHLKDGYGHQDNIYGYETAYGYKVKTEDKSYGHDAKSDPGNDGYGYQTRNTYTPEKTYYSQPEEYGKTYSQRGEHGKSYTQQQGEYGKAYSRQGVYGKAYSRQGEYGNAYSPQQADYSEASYYPYYQPRTYRKAVDPHYKQASPLSYVSDPTSYSSRGKNLQSLGYGQNVDYKRTLYDPCHRLPEGDYALQSEFTSVFPGVDPQCNFVKCANSVAYVNPCSIGTKNDQNGGPHPKHGFCAELDQKQYCGRYPTEENYFKK